MARSNAAVCASVCGMMMMAMIMGVAAQAPAPSVDCMTAVLTLSDCLGFVTGTDKAPPAACCTELSSIIKSSPQCLCLLFNTTFTQPLGVNITLAQQLPTKCNVQTPSTSLCALVGIPVPGPVSSSSPVTAPSPAATTPGSTSAPSATSSAPTPSAMSSVPTPSATSSAPTPSLASSPSPTVTAPTGSTSPAGSPTAALQPNVSTTAPSPNSAHATISWNAVAAASLLLLSSIFLS